MTGAVGLMPAGAPTSLSSTTESALETGIMPPSNGHDTEVASDTLNVADLIVRRIAKNLGVPVASLTEDFGSEPRLETISPGLIELRALLNAFLRLEHPSARRRCIATAEAELSRQLKRETEHI